MKHKLIHFDWFVNNLIVHNLFINYLNFKKEANTEAAAHRCYVAVRSRRLHMFFKIGVLENFVIFRGKHLCWSLTLRKLQACNFPVNVGKFYKSSFFYKIPPVAAFVKFIIFAGKHQCRRRIRFIFFFCKYNWNI